MTGSETHGASHEPKLPPLSPALSRPSDAPLSSSSLRRQPLSPPMLPSTSAGAASGPPLPPPHPTRLHSYHHPISASYASNSNTSTSNSSNTSSYFDRNRPTVSSLWRGARSPPLEQASFDAGPSSSSFSRVLPPLSMSSSSGSAFQLPSLSASLPSSVPWHTRPNKQQAGQNGSGPHASSFRASSEVHPNDSRGSIQETKLLSLSGQLGDLAGPGRSLAADASPAGLSSPGIDEPSQAARKQAKAHVPSACLNCKRAHLACDVGRPCRRCINLGKSDTCIDVQHKKRGRPRLKDRPSSQAGITTLQTLEGKSDISGSPASASYARHSPSSESGYFRSPTRTNELMSPPLLSSSSVMHVSGRTHGSTSQPRSASNSVSASSYPYSRPDHVRHPMDVSSGSGVGPPTSSRSYQQDGLQSFGPAHQMTGRQHSHSISYEQRYQPYQHQPYQQQQHRQNQPHQHGSNGSHASQPSTGSQAAFPAPETSDSIMSAVVTMICSTNLQCARISEECTALLGYQPSDLNERSLFELVHPSETGRLQDIWSSLIDPVGVVPQAVPAAAEEVMSTPASRLMTPAAGTIFVQENMRLRQRNGMYDFYSVRLHLGGGFGVDLYRRETLDRAYIVASLLKLGNDAAHPDPAILRSPYSHDGSQGAGFRTPSGPSATAGATLDTEQHQHQHQHGHQRHRSGSSLQRAAHFEDGGRTGDAAKPSSKGEMARSEKHRGAVKRSSAEMDEDEPASADGSAPSHSAATTAANALYTASKAAARSSPPGVRSMLSERPRNGTTSRDGILC
ncbi:hypothetical protein PHBOTO_006393 [Pseudozyma hubeiensis]|nr:hypothetical protein PHBOTO_006393 [Pseudozyma hubeiensis]